MTRHTSKFELEPPWQGMVTATGYQHQPKGTSPLMQNVRLWDMTTGRRRLSKRSGISKFVATQADVGPIQDLVQYIYAADTDGSGTQVRRTTTNLVVCEGNIEKFTSSAVSALTAGGAGALDDAVHQLFSARLFGKVYFVDGTNDIMYTGSTDTAAAWTATTAGTLPSGCKLIEMWRGRIVLSGKSTDPHNWFMSRQGDAHDWDYAPDPEDEQMAVAGNSSPAGEIGDVVKAMVPYSDDYLIFGCDHSIWMMSGDPAYGGRIDNVSEDLGMAWGRPWCVSQAKKVYFFGSRGGVWTMTPKGDLENISGNIEDDLSDVNLETNIIRMAYDTSRDHVHLYITPIDSSTVATHYVYDVQNQAWMTDKYASYLYDPYCVLVIDGDDPDDRELLLGCRDGYIRKLDDDSTADDGDAFQCICWYNPIYFRDDNWAILKEVSVVCSNSTDGVNMSVYGSDTAEETLSAAAVYTRELSPGKNFADRRRATGNRIYIKIHDEDSEAYWSIESINVVCDSVDSGRKRWISG